MDCTTQTQQWFYLCLAILILFGILFMMLLGYNLRWRSQQIELNKRTEKLEEKNGKELAELEKVKKRLDQIEQGGKHE